MTLDQISWVPLYDGGKTEWHPFLRSNREKLERLGVVGFQDDRPDSDLCDGWDLKLEKLIAMNGPLPYRPGL